jgi:hypothetical protein
MSDFSIIASHPDCQEIISKLMSGSSSKAVAQWLKLKYPKDEQSHLRITQKLLKEFSNSPLTDLYQQVRKDRSALANGGNVSAALANNKPYRDRLLETVDKEVDIVNLVTNLVHMCYQRMEQVFDVIQENPRAFKGDNYLLRYLTELSAAAERLEKLRLGQGDQLMQHNVTMEAVEEHTALLQETVREVLAEIDPDTAMLFMEKLHNKLSRLKPHQPLTQDERLKEANILEAKIVTDDDEED